MKHDLWQYIEHPPIQDNSAPPPVLPLMLTKKELQKLRRARRILKRKGLIVLWGGVERGGRDKDLRTIMLNTLMALTRKGLEVLKDKQERVILGIDPAPPPKVRVSKSIFSSTRNYIFECH